MGTVPFRPCKNCHNLFDPLALGTRTDFCSFACESEYNDKKFNDFMKTSAMLGAAASMRRQQEEQKRKEQQAAAVQQHAALDAKAQSAGFKNWQEVLKYHSPQKNETVDKILYYAKESKSTREYWDKRQAEKDKADGEVIAKGNEELLARRTEEQKKKNLQINKVSKVLDKDYELLFCFLQYLLIPLIAEIFFRHGFWRTLVYSFAIQGVLWYPVFTLFINYVIHKYAIEKEADDYPFYTIKHSYAYEAELFSLSRTSFFTGLAIFISIAVFKFQFPTFIKAFSVIVVFVVTIFQLIRMSEIKVKKDGYVFANTKEFLEYRMIKNIKKQFGPFIYETPLLYEHWKNSTTTKEFSKKTGLKGQFWRITFLPDTENSEFSEKYKNLTKSGIYSVSQLRGRESTEKNEKNSEKYKEILAEIERRKAIKIDEYDGHIMEKVCIFNASDLLKCETSSKDELTSIPFFNDELKNLMIECDFGSDNGEHGTLYEYHKNRFVKRHGVMDDEYANKLSKIERKFRNKAKKLKIKKEKEGDLIYKVSLFEIDMEYQMNIAENKAC